MNYKFKAKFILAKSPSEVKKAINRLKKALEAGNYNAPPSEWFKSYRGHAWKSMAEANRVTCKNCGKSFSIVAGVGKIPQCTAGGPESWIK